MSLPVKKKEKYAWLLTDVRKISLLPNEIKNNFHWEMADGRWELGRKAGIASTVPCRGATWEISRGQRPRSTPHKIIRPGRGGGHTPRTGRHHSRAPSGRMILFGHFPGIPSPANFHQLSGLVFSLNKPV
jgi:hypothetical protein